MEGLARELAPQFRVVEPFERQADGVELSVELHVRDLDAVFSHVLGNERTAVLGFSSGAVTAMTYAARRPERVSAVILVGSATFTAGARQEFKRQLGLRLDDASRERLRQADGLPTLEARLLARCRIVLPTYFVDPLAYPTDEWVEAQGHEQTWRDMLRLQESAAHPKEFSEIRSPVLMLHGRDDPHPGPLIFESLRQVTPQVEYVELENCGHYPWLERAARTEFLATLTIWLKLHAAVQ